MTDATISSRTPEGSPQHCPLCQAEVRLEPSAPLGDAPCPHCGCLLWFFKTASGVQCWEYHTAGPVRERVRAFVAEKLDVEVEKLPPDMRFLRDLGADSLDIAELVLALEEEFELDLGADPD